MKKFLFTLFGIFLIPYPTFLISQSQPRSPLWESFESYQQMKADSEFGLEWIPIGPTVNSARVEAVQADPSHPGTMYVAFGSGNLWKTTNHGLSWKPIFENQAAQGIGDIALAPSNPNIMYVGTGESLKKSRNFTMPGTGIYRSDDGGENWRHLGLNDSWHIGEIAVHPTNPDHVVVAVLGHFWSKNENRGLYLTTDGGKHWKHVLKIDDQTGANDVIFSNSNPKILYASLWENYPGISGEHSGIYTSQNGGKTWQKCSSGLPQGPNTGRMSVAVSHSNPNKVYTLIDNLANARENAAEVYKSVNGGKSWTKAHEEDLLIFPGIGWYFTDIYVSPTNDDEIFALGVRLAHSIDGGKHFDFIEGDVTHITPSAAQTLHLDHCELWINPQNPNHLLLGNDGGLYMSYNKGAHWMHYNNIPAGEFYDITLDYQHPYNIYGGVQDDATVFGPSVEWNPKFPDPWQYLWIDAWSGGDGCMTFVDPTDPNTVYFSLQNGHIRRKNLKTNQSKYIGPRLPKGHEGSFNTSFITPYLLSSHNPHTLFVAGNYVFKTENRGDHWALISPDLSISSDSNKIGTAAGAIAESSIKPEYLYVGTDKGAFWFSENGGAKWEERSQGLPNNYIRSIATSKYNSSRVYLTLTGINYDDLGCYIYASEDNGQNWWSIKGNLPNEIANVIIEDPWNEDILYAGLYRGVYISTDRGKSWQLLGKNLPNCSVADLEIHKPSKDLVVATHGRGIYKVNLSPIHKAFASDFDPKSLYLFQPPIAQRPKFNDTHRDPAYQTVQKVPITFWVSDSGDITLQIIGEAEIIWETSFEAHKGINQYRWDLIFNRRTSKAPYFIHYDQFIESGEYILKIQTKNSERKVPFYIKDWRNN